MPRIAFVTAIATVALDDDMPLLLAACERIGLCAEVRAWDDFTVSWARYDAVVLRSPWDYFTRLPEFLRWCERVDRVARLHNPLPILRWNTDKHYLADLEAAGIPVVPTRFVEPDTDPLPALQLFLAEFPDVAEYVVKPTVSVGSRDTQRYRREQEFAAANHIGRLLDNGRSAILQPYLHAVDTQGETALLYFDGEFSHALRKAALLRPNEPPLDHLRLPNAIAVREADADELRVADAVLSVLQTRGDGIPLYARIDLIRDSHGRPRLLELELAEPSLFLTFVPEAADRCAMALAQRIGAERVEPALAAASQRSHP
jgi:hypothetical protein